MRQYQIKNYKYGTINNIEAQSIPDGSASDSLNFITKGDHIEMRRGSIILGTLQLGSARVLGIHIAVTAEGTQIIYVKRGKKLFYFDTITSDFIEVGSDLFGTAGEDDEVACANYVSLAGAQLWICSPNSSLFKIMTANPGSYTDMYNSAKNFKGYIKITQNRMWLWNRNEDKTGVYGSYIDSGDYTTVTGEATTSLTGTLAFKAAGPKRTCFGVIITITASGEVYTDNYDGTLTGSLGGTGTINYTSGVYTLSNPGVGTADYQWEDSTDGGVADFSKSGTRLAGEGFIFRQDTGGRLMTILSYGATEYCLHENNAWALTLTADDTDATNLIFRENVGIANWRCAVATGKGIYYMDISDQTKPLFKILTLERTSSEVIPITVSVNYDFADYRFDYGVMEEWDDFILIHCRHKDSEQNNTTFIYSKIWKSIDRLDYFASCAAIYNGTYIVGDSVTDNVWTLFSGFDDDDASINSYWEGNLSKLGIENLKKNKELILQGLIAVNQSYKVYLNPDNSGYSEIGTIEGTGAYVDFNTAVYVGADTIGSQEIGGGGDGVYAYNYVHGLRTNVGKFREAKVKIVPQELGYISLSEQNFRDIRVYANKLPEKYR